MKGGINNKKVVGVITPTLKLFKQWIFEVGYKKYSKEEYRFMMIRTVDDICGSYFYAIEKGYDNEKVSSEVHELSEKDSNKRIKHEIVDKDGKTNTAVYICQNADSRDSECLSCKYSTGVKELVPNWEFICLRTKIIAKEKGGQSGS